MTSHQKFDPQCRRNCPKIRICTYERDELARAIDKDSRFLYSPILTGLTPFTNSLQKSPLISLVHLYELTPFNPFFHYLPIMVFYIEHPAFSVPYHNTSIPIESPRIERVIFVQIITIMI